MFIQSDTYTSGSAQDLLAGVGDLIGYRNCGQFTHSRQEPRMFILMVSGRFNRTQKVAERRLDKNRIQTGHNMTGTGQTMKNISIHIITKKYFSCYV